MSVTSIYPATLLLKRPLNNIELSKVRNGNFIDISLLSLLSYFVWRRLDDFEYFINQTYDKSIVDEEIIVANSKKKPVEHGR